jgi:hypothetical protein
MSLGVDPSAGRATIIVARLRLMVPASRKGSNGNSKAERRIAVPVG